jgi:hypothetical protein
LLLNLVVGRQNLREKDSICIVGSNRGNAVQDEVVAYENNTDGPQEVFIVVDNSRPRASGSFKMKVWLYDILPGDSCENAIAISDGLLSAQSWVGYGNNYGNANTGRELARGCGYQAGIDRVYTLDLPPGKILRATVTPDNNYDLGLTIVTGRVDNCNLNPRLCATYADDNSEGEADTVEYLNESNLPEPIFLMVDSYFPENYDGTYRLRVDIIDPP